MQKRVWITFFLFKELLVFFKKSIPSGESFTNRHLLALDGHGSHVTLEAIEQTLKFEFKMITLPSYTSCSITIICVLFQAIENNIQKG